MDMQNSITDIQRIPMMRYIEMDKRIIKIIKEISMLNGDECRTGMHLTLSLATHAQSWRVWKMKYHKTIYHEY